MSKQEIIKIFGDRKIRSVWDDEAEIWYFSIVDVVAVLTESVNPANYWKMLKNRLKKEGNQSVTNCNQLKLRAADGKYYKLMWRPPSRCFALYSRFPRPRPSRSKCGWPKSRRNGLTRCRTRNFPSSRRWRITDGWDIRRSGLPAASPLNASDTGALDVETGDMLPPPTFPTSK